VLCISASGDRNGRVRRESCGQYINGWTVVNNLLAFALDALRAPLRPGLMPTQILDPVVAAVPKYWATFELRTSIFRPETRAVLTPTGSRSGQLNRRNDLNTYAFYERAHRRFCLFRWQWQLGRRFFLFRWQWQLGKQLSPFLPAKKVPIAA
jgi:hypothetical protein